MPKQHAFSPTGYYVEQAINNLISETQAATRAVKNFFSKYSWREVRDPGVSGVIANDGRRIDTYIEGWGNVYCVLSEARDGDTVIKNYNELYDTAQSYRRDIIHVKRLSGSNWAEFTADGYAIMHYSPNRGETQSVTFAFFSNNNMPVCGAKKFIERMPSIFSGYEKKKKKKRKWYGVGVTLKGAINSFITVGSVWVLGYAGAALGAALKAGTALTSLAGIGAIGGVVAGIGGVITTFGNIAGSTTLRAIGLKISAAGAIMSFGGSISTFTSPAAANANASILPNYSVANSQALSQTTSLYQNVSVASFASPVNSLKSLNNSFLYITKGLNFVSDTLDTINAVKNLIAPFRQPNAYKDEDMPLANASEEEKHVVGVSEDFDALEEEGFFVRRFFDRDVEYDLGLEAGTIMSNDGSLLKNEV